MTDIKRVLIMAGGTGGHVFPGLALADCLRKHQIDVEWLGTSKGIEARVVPESGIPLHFLSITGVRGKGIKTLLTAPFQIVSAILEAKRVIQKTNPDVVVGMGGFVSGPGGVASWLLRRPLVIHEQNARAGMTNKILSRVAKRVLEGFPAVFSNQSNVTMVGNPVRSEIERLPAPGVASEPSRPLKLLVLGGSLGAKAINELLPKTLAAISPNERPEVMHQTGEAHTDSVKKEYESMGIQADVKPFIKDMAEAYQWADLVICRAGALTVAELCAAGKGAIFIPFPHAVDDHQTANAQFMVKDGAAICLPQATLTPEKLTATLKDYIHSREKCLKMAEAAYALRNVNVPEKIFGILVDVVG